MPTLTDALMTATSALNDATTAVRGTLAAMQAIRDSAVASTTTVIQQATPLSRVWYVDPVNGSDTGTGRDGSGRGKEFKSIEAVARVAAPATKHLILLLGDCEIGYREGLYADLGIVGAAYADGVSSTTVNTQRRLSFRPEALNSPQPSSSPYAGRHTAGLFLYSVSLGFTNIDLVLPDVPAGVAYTAALIAGTYSAVTGQSCTLTGTAQGNSGRFIKNADSTPVQFFYGGTIASSLSGRIFDGIAAGADPNVGKRFITNLTTN